MVYDVTARVEEAREYYDKILDENIKEISERSGVDPSLMVKINPADFIVKNQNQYIDGYNYVSIRRWIETKKTEGNYLISPVDAIEETAEQISYKENVHIETKVRASKCDIVPMCKELAQDFFKKNHRQSPPLWRGTAVCFGLALKSEIVAVMMYDRSDGAVRGKKKNYELVRLAIKHGYMVHGGASRLQKVCEGTLREMGEEEIFSYSNATINNLSLIHI